MKARLYHVQVNVRDAAVSLPFWTALLGFLEYRVVHAERDVAGFSNGTTDLWLMATEPAQAGPESVPQGRPFACTAPARLVLRPSGGVLANIIEALLARRGGPR